MARSTPFIFLITLISSSTLAKATYNIVDFGAQPDGLTDSSGPITSAWAKACSSVRPASVYIPVGTFYVSRLTLKGPCNNTDIRIYIHGTLVAPVGYNTDDRWIGIQFVDGVSVYGGVFDGRGQRLWSCKLAAGYSCPLGATVSLKNPLQILTIGPMDYELTICVYMFAQSIAISRSRMGEADQVTITGSYIRTGDDCVSMGPGSTNVWIEGIHCGPGHGVSIGSLGSTAQEPGVQNVTVKSVVFTGTQNGLRIKTWAKPNTGFVQRVNFQNAIMRNVQNPIIIDQSYCPGAINCPTQSSGIRISQVTYSNIQGSSATPVAVKFDCSPSNPCNGIGLQNVNLTYGRTPAQSLCRNVAGSTTSGIVVPPSCFGT
ncbi:uncharacterized protein A4U43_C09F5210 [Asparagus officinalis]|uniref:Polygalacturonase n=1 Tax=Asparagus officinalis TaxID=4686 RepID=A0A5P1E8Q9_ASPOF|nr:polygalacturonase-like [Asparagus officinalis]ONK57885.1 uncharacterized protein A4U43_C09F5210 [Asparagus officinalis]